ncbi:hypothetical protein O3P69_016995 [Scylla paramamosain]|uniref:Uncharacterized protein n=1 Tax=Scylla paramamosain TaxID=85552 RepID=A0AAW0TXY3_SCYPA
MAAMRCAAGREVGPGESRARIRGRVSGVALPPVTARTPPLPVRLMLRRCRLHGVQRVSGGTGRRPSSARRHAAPPPAAAVSAESRTMTPTTQRRDQRPAMSGPGRAPLGGCCNMALLPASGGGPQPSPAPPGPPHTSVHSCLHTKQSS